QCASFTEALPYLQRGCTMVLLDVDLGSVRAIEFIENARRAGFTGKILIVTAGTSGHEAVQLVQGGAAGILHKQHSVQEFCESIGKVAAGGSCLESTYLTSLFHSIDRTRPDGRVKLTERDRAVLRYILQGLTNKDIAARLGISEGAVKASLQL